MPDPMHFDARAEVYDRARPPYPEALWARLREFGLLRPDARVVELGAGTGQATARFLDAGADVTAIEPGHALAVRLRERCPDARVVVARAEDAVLADARYDIAVAATRCTGSTWTSSFPSCIGHSFPVVISRYGVPPSAIPAGRSRRSESV